MTIAPERRCIRKLSRISNLSASVARSAAAATAASAGARWSSLLIDLCGKHTVSQSGADCCRLCRINRYVSGGQLYTPTRFPGRSLDGNVIVGHRCCRFDGKIEMTCTNQACRPATDCASLLQAATSPVLITDYRTPFLSTPYNWIDYWQLQRQRRDLSALCCDLGPPL